MLLEMMQGGEKDKKKKKAGSECDRAAARLFHVACARMLREGARDVLFLCKSLCK